MKTKVLASIPAILVTLAACSAVNAADITLTNPNGGESLVAGRTLDVNWTAEETIQNVRLEFSADNGAAWNTIEPNAPNNGTCLWTLPEINSNQCLLRISDVDDSQTNDTSDAPFTIYICPLLFDLNFDCIVNFLDFALLASQWLIDGTTHEFFNYTITATGTQDVLIYPDRNFEWAVTTTATETWTEYDTNSLYVNCYGYRTYCMHYLYPPDSNYTVYDWNYTGSSSAHGGGNAGTQIDTAGNRLIIRAFSGGREDEWCCGGYIFGSCMGWCTDYTSGYWQATYRLNARKTSTATVAKTQSGNATVNATEGDKFIANFNLDAPDP
ncbi:MAG: hypothetical protein ACYS8Z_23405, partial [Planctomycetota bacterium]